MYNYWIRQNDRETLAADIRTHLIKKHGGQFDPARQQQYAQEIRDYLKAQQKTGFKVLCDIDIRTGKLTVEVV